MGLSTDDKIKRIAKIFSYCVLYIIFICTALSIVWILKKQFNLATVLYVILPIIQIILILKNANLHTNNFRSIFLDLIIPMISGYFYLILALANIFYRSEQTFNLSIVGFSHLEDILIWFGYFINLTATLYLHKYFTVFAEANGLVTSGPYKYVRNPIYTGYIISTIGGLIKFFSLEAFIVALVYFSLFLIRAFEEEKLLQEKFGEEYIKYKKKTGRFLPKISIN